MNMTNWVPLSSIPQKNAIGRMATTGPYCWGTILYFRKGGQDVCLSTGSGMRFARVDDCEVEVRKDGDEFDREEIANELGL